MRKTRQSGFTLIELMIVVVLMAMLLAIGVILTFSFYQRDLSAVERENLDTRRSVLLESLQSDLDSAGSGFVRPADRYFSGSEFLTFASHPDYETGNGNLYRRDFTTDDPLRADSNLTSSTGRFEFTVSSVREVIVNIIGNGYTDERVLYLAGDSWCVIEEGRCVADQNGEAGGAKDGDSYSIQLDNDLESGGRIFTFFRLRDRERVLLHRSRMPATATNYFLQIQMAHGDYLSQVRGTGVFESVGDAANSLEETLLPMFGNERSNNYVQRTSEDEGFSILRGESTTDYLRLTQPLYFGSPKDDVVLYTETLRRGEYKSGDYALLADYKNKKSVVLQYRDDSDPASGKFVFTPVSESMGYRAFDLLWSQDADFLGHEFQPSQSRLIKLSPPVFYRIVSAGELRQIERRIGFGNWDLVELSVKFFTIDILYDSAQRPSYRVRAEIYGEGVESTSPTDQLPPVREINFTVNPRSFSQAGSQSE